MRMKTFRFTAYMCLSNTVIMGIKPFIKDGEDYLYVALFDNDRGIISRVSQSRVKYTYREGKPFFRSRGNIYYLSEFIRVRYP